MLVSLIFLGEEKTGYPQINGMDEMSASKTVNSLLQVSWLRHSTPIPQLLAVNNITNTPDPRYKALVSGGWSEFLLVIKDARPRDTSQYECQVSGPRHSSLHKFITLTVIGEQVMGREGYRGKDSCLQSHG